MLSNTVKSKEIIEDIIKEVDSFEPVVLLRIGIARFMEKLSFDERYFKKVREYKRNKKEIGRNNRLIGLLRAIK